MPPDPYDNNGNLLNSGTGTNTWDFENHLIQDGNVSIVYDGDGNRVAETVAGVTTKYLVDDVNPTHLPQVVDELVNGSVTRTYAYGLQLISENQLINGVWTPSFYGYDGHGSVRFLTNAIGRISDTYEYDAFGNLIASTGTTPNNYLFAGEQFDPALGLYQMRARWYQETNGRFISRDPVEGVLCCGMSWNPYIYSKNNPVNSVDPTGEADLVEYAAKVADFVDKYNIVNGTNEYGVCQQDAFSFMSLALLDPLHADDYGKDVAFTEFACMLVVVEGPINPLPLKPVNPLPSKPVGSGTF